MICWPTSDLYAFWMWLEKLTLFLLEETFFAGIQYRKGGKFGSDFHANSDHFSVFLIYIPRASLHESYSDRPYHGEGEQLGYTPLCTVVRMRTSLLALALVINDNCLYLWKSWVRLLAGTRCIDTRKRSRHYCAPSTSSGHALVWTTGSLDPAARRMHDW